MTLEIVLQEALEAGLRALGEYLSAHVLTCLVPAFFIAGAISALLQKETVLRYFGEESPKWLCYSVAATSGTILAAILLAAASNLLEWQQKAIIVGSLAFLAALLMKTYYLPEEREAFFGETWWLAKRIFPLLMAGSFITGVIGYFLPVEAVRNIFGTSSFLACFVASVIGAVLYMPTLLEVPIVGTLFGYSTGVTAAGPALSLLLAGPSLSLPSMIVIVRVIGLKKGAAYVALVVILSTLMGMAYGLMA